MVAASKVLVSARLAAAVPFLSSAANRVPHPLHPTTRPIMKALQWVFHYRDSGNSSFFVVAAPHESDRQAWRECCCIEAEHSRKVSKKKEPHFIFLLLNATVLRALGQHTTEKQELYGKVVRKACQSQVAPVSTAGDETRR
jgi:hypothetical protein